MPSAATPFVVNVRLEANVSVSRELFPGDKTPAMVVAPPMTPEPASVPAAFTASTPVAADWLPFTINAPPFTVVVPV